MEKDLLVSFVTESEPSRVTVFPDSSVQHPNSLEMNLKTGDFVELRLQVDSNCSNAKLLQTFVAVVEEITPQDSKVQVQYMKKSGKYWIWPQDEKDIERSTEDYRMITKILSEPKIMNSREHMFFKEL